MYLAVRQPQIFQTAYDANNIRRAWIFAAALVLGFASLGEGGANADVRGAFRSSQSVLRTFGHLSAQSEQYYRIITSFSDTIDEYWGQIDGGRRQSKRPLVERIFSLKNQGEHSSWEGTSPGIELPAPNITTTGGLDTMWLPDDATSSLTGLLPYNGSWLPLADDELMLRMLWDNATTLIDSNTQANRDASL